MDVYVIEIGGDVLGVRTDKQIAYGLMRDIMVERYGADALVEVQGGIHVGEPRIGDKIHGMIWEYTLDDTSVLELEISRRKAFKERQGD